MYKNLTFVTCKMDVLVHSAAAATCKMQTKICGP